MSANKNIPPIALWNPTWIVIWSFIFTPIFGAILQKLNWQEMGDGELADSCGIWVIFGIIVYGVYLLCEPFLPDLPAMDFLFIGIWVLFYALWAITQGPRQIRTVRQRYGSTYHHKLWGKALMLGAGCMLLYCAVEMTYLMLLVLTNVVQVP